MELEESNIEFKPVVDVRPTMPLPPPVRLVSVEDVHLAMPAGLEVQLDAFYVGLLKFEREPTDHGTISYKADNFRLKFEVLEKPAERDDLRQVGIDVLSLRTLERELVEREIEFAKQRGLFAGQISLLLQDPAGNWIQVGENRRV